MYQKKNYFSSAAMINCHVGSLRCVFFPHKITKHIYIVI